MFFEGDSKPCGKDVPIDFFLLVNVILCRLDFLPVFLIEISNLRFRNFRLMGRYRRVIERNERLTLDDGLAFLDEHVLDDCVGADPQGFFSWKAQAAASLYLVHKLAARDRH